MTKKISQVNIFLGDPKTRSDVAQGLRIIADNIESGFSSGIAGWSDVSWNIDMSDEEDEEEESDE